MGTSLLISFPYCSLFSDAWENKGKSEEAFCSGFCYMAIIGNWSFIWFSTHDALPGPVLRNALQGRHGHTGRSSEMTHKNTQKSRQGGVQPLPVQRPNPARKVGSSGSFVWLTPATPRSLQRRETRACVLFPHPCIKVGAGLLLPPLWCTHPRSEPFCQSPPCTSGLELSWPILPPPPASRLGPGPSCFTLALHIWIGAAPPCPHPRQTDQHWVAQLPHFPRLLPTAGLGLPAGSSRGIRYNP